MAIDRQQKLIQIVNQELVLFRASDVVGFFHVFRHYFDKTKIYSIQYVFNIFTSGQRSTCTCGCYEQWQFNAFYTEFAQYILVNNVYSLKHIQIHVVCNIDLTRKECNENDDFCSNTTYSILKYIIYL